MALPRTKNSLTAHLGRNAEKLICIQPNVKPALETHFGKEIRSITEVPGNKKSDNCITFVDGSHVLLQNKDGICSATGRGHSTDRSSLEVMGHTPEFRQGLETVCLKRGDYRYKKGVIREGDDKLTKAMSQDCINYRILGTDEATKPTHFTHTTSKNGVITSLSITTAADFMAKLSSTLYDNMKSKRTCIWLSDQIYLQRKGAKTDKKADDIQMKLRLDASGFTKLPLVQPTVTSTPSESTPQ